MSNFTLTAAKRIIRKAQAVLTAPLSVTPILGRLNKYIIPYQKNKKGVLDV